MPDVYVTIQLNPHEQVHGSPPPKTSQTPAEHGGVEHAAPKSKIIAPWETTAQVIRTTPSHLKAHHPPRIGHVIPTARCACFPLENFPRAAHPVPERGEGELEESRAHERNETQRKSCSRVAFERHEHDAYSESFPYVLLHVCGTLANKDTQKKVLSGSSSISLKSKRSKLMMARDKAKSRRRHVQERITKEPKPLHICSTRQTSTSTWVYCRPDDARQIPVRYFFLALPPSPPPLGITPVTTMSIRDFPLPLSTAIPFSFFPFQSFSLALLQLIPL
ncbi:hypothetical protein RHS01_09127 [Rhizoctonia solani]|uniref:Uncharacterized protein n=1 Tax=Rhizoctonia solani TaxID=456999 RepID=A0A8H7I9X0_9AGAM|nr:hypothetical protein RHS01_09127 [Rhizoctonia solani]